MATTVLTVPRPADTQSERQPRPEVQSMIRFRDFRGVNCYVGAFVLLLGLLALGGDATAQGAAMRCGWGLGMFAGGLSVGVGLMRNAGVRQKVLSKELR
jgi:hypothetical protein